MAVGKLPRDSFLTTENVCPPSSSIALLKDFPGSALEATQYMQSCCGTWFAKHVQQVKVSWDRDEPIRVLNSETADYACLSKQDNCSVSGEVRAL